MKVRFMGTREECEFVVKYFKEFASKTFFKSLSISNLYANRNSLDMYRVYIEYQLHDNSSNLLLQGVNHNEKNR